MKKNVLIVSSSPVPNGKANSDMLCREFARGAEECGHNVEFVALRDKRINFCMGCDICVREGNGCVQQDDMREMIEKMHTADVFVLATPIYFMSVSAQLKVFIDRLIAGESHIRKNGGKKAYFITVSASPDTDENHRPANETFRGLLRCLRTVQEGGVLNAGGAYTPGSIAGMNWMEKAYEMGKTV